ncbi:HD domain-containing protein [Bradyrhizobium sp. SZCCHNR1070]|uniref:HD domain-containing protein n=1 Tax=Bradyrhizobium sp. SZCCHNR1070 TaxID=3057361 RepID=UPI002915DB51|nr:HD domain-containing protein [Bradyrhizobium sp. SZCCHNR1070]
MPSIEETLEFVKRAHGDQKDKGGMPYWHHLVAVMNGLPAYADDDWKCAALLHDVLEDTPTTAEDLRKMGYSEAVITAVELVTKPKGADYLRWIEDLRDSNNAIAKAIKRADLEHNLDPSRFHNLDGATRERLLQKYNHAKILLLS